LGPGTRTALLGTGIAFCLLFALITLWATAETGFSFLTLVSVLVIAMLAIGLIGAIRNPPSE
jgi:hypothetical protein